MLVLSKHLPSRNTSQSLKEYSFLLQMHPSDSAQPILKKQINMTINSIV
jgi:hypothetical protein